MRSYADFTSRETAQSTINLHPKKAPIKSRVQSALALVWKHLISAMSGNSEVQVQQVRDRTGKAYWRIYDPVTGYRNTLLSETEVRIWLERRYSF
jgi:hypothetical protein